VSGRSVGEVGALPIVHMRALMRGGRLSEQLVKDVLGRNVPEAQQPHAFVEQSAQQAAAVAGEGAWCHNRGSSRTYCSWDVSSTRSASELFPSWTCSVLGLHRGLVIYVSGCRWAEVSWQRREPSDC
jgi:hypothetical protein